jgi:hypothetical protein
MIRVIPLRSNCTLWSSSDLDREDVIRCLSIGDVLCSIGSGHTMTLVITSEGDVGWVVNGSVDVSSTEL